NIGPIANVTGVRIGLSTAFVGARGLSPDGALDVLLRAGAGGVELDASLPPPLLDELSARLRARREELPVWAVENPCPAPARAEPQLASIDRSETRAAIE